MADQLLFVPLGGVGEIGMNVYCYGLGDRWMMVDLGIGFADDRLPGAEIVLPDLRFIEERRKHLDGLVITHAHEDHIGAVLLSLAAHRLPDLVHGLRGGRAARARSTRPGWRRGR